MIGREKIIRLLKDVVSRSRADQTEALFLGSDFGLTRFANSYIHQNVADQNNNVSFKVAVGKKIGAASTNIFEKEDLQRSCEKAIEIAEHARPIPYFKRFALPAKFKRLSSFYETTARVTPSKRALVVKRICDKAEKNGFVGSGALSTSVSEIAIVNSNGVAAYQPNTSSSVNIIFSSESSSGYAQGLGRRFDKVDFDSLSTKALEKCRLAVDPGVLEPGKYDVILEPVAVANLLEWLTFIAFAADPYHEKTSFLSGQKGKRIAIPGLSIYDDGLDSKGIAFPFDFEGVPKKRVYFIRNGLGGVPVYNLLTAAKYKARTTGHGTPPGWTGGPMPLNIHVAPGKIPFAKMLSTVRRGILVTRFHYINGFLDTPRALLTGMTRDGTFLVENGKIIGGVKNLRFTESMVGAFANIQAISREIELVDTWWSDVGCISAPAMVIRNFNFSGKTEF
jgi:predicted Zn-dependent protease